MRKMYYKARESLHLKQHFPPLPCLHYKRYHSWILLFSPSLKSSWTNEAPSTDLYISHADSFASRTTGNLFRMAITHADLSIRNYRIADIGSKLGHFLVFFSVLCGLFSFVLCLAAEATRSEATWVILSSERDGQSSQCFYSGSGRTPLTCAVGAFLVLAVAMFTEHAYMLVAVTSPPSPASDPDNPSSSSSSKSLTWQTCFLFLTTWICFAIAEILLMIGIGVESGHLSSWRKPRANCISVRPALFAAAGVFGLTTVFIGGGLYLTVLQSQILHQEENTRRGVPDASLYPSNQHRFPPSAPQVPRTMRANEIQLPQGDPSHSKTSTSA